MRGKAIKKGIEAAKRDNESSILAKATYIKNMTREIKFRAYRKDLKPEQKVMEYLGGFEEMRLLWKIYPDTDFEKYDFMQFTGLLDKNGKEIYEGDIIILEGGHAMEIKFEKGAFSADRIYGGSEAYRMEVIGNIYESKHLLDNTDTKE